MKPLGAQENTPLDKKKHMLWVFICTRYRLKIVFRVWEYNIYDQSPGIVYTYAYTRYFHVFIYFFDRKVPFTHCPLLKMVWFKWKH